MEAPEPYQRMEHERQELLKSPRLKSARQTSSMSSAASNVGNEDQTAAERAALARAEVLTEH